VSLPRARTQIHGLRIILLEVGVHDVRLSVRETDIQVTLEDDENCLYFFIDRLIRRSLPESRTRKLGDCRRQNG
jgi:hypothetical protein